MRVSRIIGNNCRLQLIQNNVSADTFADALGYSLSDVEKLCDGRLFVTEKDVADIADYFGISEDDLYRDYGQAQYTGESFMHCMGQFKREENKDLILDIFDMYCDLKEALEE